MRNTSQDTNHAALDQRAAEIDQRLAQRLADLRQQRGWSLEALAEQSGISRATLSRLERGESSPTASLLGRLCASYGLPMSRLLAEVEVEPVRLLRAAAQPVWIDPETGFRRRGVAPPMTGFNVDLVEGQIPPGTTLSYERSPQPGLEHHIWLLEGELHYTLGSETFALRPGDSLSFRLFDATRFHNPATTPARYLIALGRP
ncbi:XRE family transcriptional regulator [Chitinimonas sp.]|uniref:helix-turn-helix domain-containing protein n=1 Tax=Chitinimonas sp. TaxID=1934313 RepID=UPI002F934249